MATKIEITPIKDENKFNLLKQDNRCKYLDEKLLKIMYTRGIDTPEKVYSFLRDNINYLETPDNLKDSDKFCKIVNEAIMNNFTIIFYGDYDVDGIGAGLTGVKGLREYAKLKNSSSHINWFANNRFDEGYGITAKGVDNLLAKYPDTKLIITVDNGIVGYEGVKRAKELGLKIIVTDHHEEGEISTIADAIIDPKQKDCNSKFKSLCGAGVIFKLLLKLFWDDNLNIDYVLSLVDIVSLSTVADLVPLIDDNRIIVKEGLKLIQREDRVQFRILRQAYNTIKSVQRQSGLSVINEETLGFTYGPALNSLGRIDGCIDKAMELFLIDDEEKMFELATYIFNKNAERKLLTSDKNIEAYEQIVKLYPDGNYPPVMVITLENNEIADIEGIIGLVASYVKELCNRPAIVLTKTKKDGENIYKGSARSIEGFNITQAFNKTKKHLLGFGGHAMAGGLSIKEENIEPFIKSIIKYAQPLLTEDILTKKIYVDFACSTSEVTEDLIDDLDMLRPYGTGFEKPNIGLTDMEVNLDLYNPPVYGSIFCGADKMTVRLLKDDGFTVMMFKHPEIMFTENMTNRVSNNKFIVKPIGFPCINIFNGQKKFQLQVTENYLF